MQLIDDIKSLYYESFLLIKKHWFLFFLSVFLNALFLLSLILANRYVLINASDSLNKINLIMQESTKGLNATELFDVEGKLMNNTEFVESYKNVREYIFRFLAASVLSFFVLFGICWFFVYKISEVDIDWKRFVLCFVFMSLLSMFLLFFVVARTPNSWSRLLLFLLLHYAVVVSFSSFNKHPLFKLIGEKLQDKRVIVNYLAGLFILIVLIINNAFLFSRIEQYSYFLYLSFAWLLLIVLPFISFLGVCFVRLIDEE